MKLFICSCLLFMAIGTACKGQSALNEPVTMLNKDDPNFLALKDTAQKYMPQFIEAVLKNTEGLKFVIKSEFKDGETHEHMLSQVFEFKSNKFSGVFIDSAINVKNVHLGDAVSVNIKAVEDWAIYNDKGERIAGAFSEQYLEDKRR